MLRVAVRSIYALYAKKEKWRDGARSDINYTTRGRISQEIRKRNIQELLLDS